MCLVDRCEADDYAKGLCKKHYKRQWRTGSLSISRAEPNSLKKWLEDRKDFSSEECLTWPFSRNWAGYGQVTFGDKKVNAHRYMCILANGEESDLYALHSCGNGHLGCVNPKHLYWGTQKQNEADKLRDDTHIRGERQYGSIFTEEQVLQIRELAKTVSTKLLAARFGCSEGAIYGISSRRTWAWLE